jgi:hypothetical protein
MTLATIRRAVLGVALVATLGPKKHFARDSYRQMI